MPSLKTNPCGPASATWVFFARHSNLDLIYAGEWLDDFQALEKIICRLQTTCSRVFVDYKRQITPSRNRIPNLFPN
jgi:hypothetical protein